MTPSQDDDNPFSRPSVWPKMPQAPFRVGGLPMAAPLSPSPVVTDRIPSAERPAEPPVPPPVAQDFAPAPLAARPHRSPAPRLTPLVAAAAVGAGALLALGLLVVADQAPRSPAASTSSSSALAIGQLVGRAAPTPGASQPSPTPRIAEAVSAPAPTTSPPPIKASALKRLGAGAPAPIKTALSTPAPPQTSLPPPLSVESAPLSLPATQPFVPPPAPDREAPIPTHVPDQS